MSYLVFTSYPRSIDTTLGIIFKIIDPGLKKHRVNQIIITVDKMIILCRYLCQIYGSVYFVNRHAKSIFFLPYMHNLAGVFLRILGTYLASAIGGAIVPDLNLEREGRLLVQNALNTPRNRVLMVVSNNSCRQNMLAICHLYVTLLGVTSQWPPLSGPIRRILNDFLNSTVFDSVFGSFNQFSNVCLILYHIFPQSARGKCKNLSSRGGCSPPPPRGVLRRWVDAL